MKAYIPRKGFFRKVPILPMDAITTYFNEALQELHAVRWPTRQQAIRLLLIVLGFTAAATAAFGSIDFVLSKAVTLLLSFTY